jgi:hypothetical protein
MAVFNALAFSPFSFHDRDSRFFLSTALAVLNHSCPKALLPVHLQFAVVAGVCPRQQSTAAAS